MESHDKSPRYLDGVSSLSQLVNLSMTEQSLIINSDGKSPVIWPYDKIFVKEDWHDITGAILGHKDNSNEGLAIHDFQQLLMIQKKLLRRNRASFIIPIQYRHLFLLSIAAVISFFSFFPLLSHLSGLVTFFIPYGAEKKLGDTVLTDMADEFEPCDDKETLAILQKIVDRLYESLDNKTFKPEIHIFRSYNSNAYSLPGGKIVVLSELLTDAESEGEIAAVFAHEMGHMVERDSLEAFTKFLGVNLIINMMSSSGAYGDIIKLGSLIQGMSYSREKEFAADEFGMRLLMKAGYSSKGLISFLSRADKEDKSSDDVMKYAEFLSTHPDIKERIRRIDKPPRMGRYRPSITEEEFQHIKKSCSFKSIPPKELTR